MLKTLLLILAFFVASPALATTFKIASVAPDGSSWMRAMQAASEQIRTQTEGRVEFRFYAGGVMGSDSTVMKKIRLKQLHGGALTSGSLAARYPAIDVFALPFAFQDHDGVSATLAAIDSDLQNGLRDNGFELLGLTETGFAYLMSSHPLRRVEDLQARKPWVPEGDKLAEAMYAAAGIRPVPLAIADVYTGLQTGIIDTVAVPPVGAIALQWHSNMRYAIDMPLIYVMGALVIEAQSFARLSAADQSIVRSSFAAAVQQLNQQSREDNRNARAALEKLGIEFIPLAAEEQARWQQLGAKVRTDFLQQLDPALVAKLPPAQP